MSQTAVLDYQATYTAMPGLFIVLSPGPDFTILDVSDDFLAATHSRRERTVGAKLTDVFPDHHDNPLEPGSSGKASLLAALQRVAATRSPEKIEVQSFNIRRADVDGGGFMLRHWNQTSIPVLAKDGAMVSILHKVEDVTDFVALSRRVEEHQQRSDDRQKESDTKHQKNMDRSQKLNAAANSALRLANEQQSEASEKELQLERGERTKSDIRHLEILSQSQLAGAATAKGLRLANEKQTENSANELKMEQGERIKTQDTLTRTEEQLRQVQKMEAVGLLAGGVAHDFNNILSVIIGYGGIIMEKLAPQDQVREGMDQILRAAARATDLTRQLLTFSRQEVVEPQVLSVEKIIIDMEKMIRRLIGDDVELKCILKSSMTRIFADPGHVEQVIMNLVVNARDAMPGGGTIILESANVDLDGTNTVGRIDVTPGPFVMLAISDTGVGMDAETQTRIFEPFFTTKQKGHGTGLGLSTVHGIVKQCRGNIWVYSELGKGTTFKVFFPRHEGEENVIIGSPALPDLARGTETILLVEDDAQILGMVRSILSGKGYKVLAVQNGAEALKISQSHQDVVHLLLTDVIMPKMNGRDLAEKLKALRTDLRVLYMSGYTDNVITQFNVLDAGIMLLQKPFTPDGLARRVRAAIDMAP